MPSTRTSSKWGARPSIIIDLKLPPATSVGTFVSPAAYEIESLAALEREVFGPVLHVVRYQGGHLDKVIAAINASGFGLTLGPAFPHRRRR